MRVCARISWLCACLLPDIKCNGFLKIVKWGCILLDAPGAYMRVDFSWLASAGFLTLEKCGVEILLVKNTNNCLRSFAELGMTRWGFNKIDFSRCSKS